MNSTKKSGKRKDLHDKPRMPSAVPKRNRVLDDEDDDEDANDNGDVSDDDGSGDGTGNGNGDGDGNINDDDEDVDDDDDVDDIDVDTSDGAEEKDMYNAFVRQFRSSAHLTKVRSKYHKLAIQKVIKASGWETFSRKEMVVAMALMALQVGEYQIRLKRQAVKLQKSEATTRETKTKSNLRDVYKWNGKEAMLAESVVTWCKEFLFPRYKFLKGRWYEYTPDKRGSMCGLVLNKVHMLLQSSRMGRVSERVVVPSIKLKYTNMKSNINSVVKRIYAGE